MQNSVASGVTEKVEREMLLALINLLDSDTFNVEKAQQVAAEYLALLPYKDDTDFHDKVKLFTDKYPELKRMYIALLNYDEEKKTDDLLTKMRGLMKNNKIEEAIKMAQS